MRKKGTKRRIMVTLMAVMLLMATSMTAFAKSYYGVHVYGQLDKIGTSAAQAYTRNIKSNRGSVYVSLTVEYMSSLGNSYTTTPVTQSGVTSATVNKTITGSFVSAWSNHGVTGKEFQLIIGFSGG